MTVLEIGPDTVGVLGCAGPPVDRRLVRDALEWIDDPVGLHDDRPVASADLWRAVVASALRGRRGPVVVVHPDDWSSRRVGIVVAAADAVGAAAGDVVAVPRSRWTAPDPAPDPDSRPADAPELLDRRRRWIAVLGAGAVVLLALAVVSGRPPRPPAPEPVPAARTVVEGRISVRVPASWPVVRVTGGPGSRRLQADSPDDPELALHITQAYAPESTLGQAAETLGRAIAEQPAGVFSDFRAEAGVAGRPAVTYREIRPGRVIDWSVVLVGSTLVGIGCQSPPPRTDAVRAACEQAVSSVREAGGRAAEP